MRNPRGRFLAESFYERFFYNDLLGSEDDPQLSAANLMAMLVFPGILCLYLIPKYYVTLRHAPEHVRALEVLGDRYLWFAYSMSMLGLLTALQWDRLFPDERDYFVIGPQPTPTRAVFEAQAVALCRYLGLFALLIHIGSAVFFPLGTAPREAGLLEGLGFSIAHWLCLALASVFVVSAVAGLQGVLLLALPTRLFRRLSGVVATAAGHDVLRLDHPAAGAAVGGVVGRRAGGRPRSGGPAPGPAAATCGSRRWSTGSPRWLSGELAALCRACARRGGLDGCAGRRELLAQLSPVLGALPRVFGGRRARSASLPSCGSLLRTMRRGPRGLQPSRSRL